MIIETLDKEDIFLIHQQTIEEFGGELGHFDNTDGKVQSILSQQYPSFGYEKYPTIFNKASMLMYFFIKGHCFRDGNKRVGLTVSKVFLGINGIELDLTNEQAIQLTLSIASCTLRNIQIDKFIFEDLTSILEDNSYYEE
ncbi:death ON curing protein [Clostridium botulinum C str. Eklund]|nr:death ON curing protein [Clostridium botulinum C str. Eklund]